MPYSYLSGHNLVWGDEFEDADLSRFSEAGNVSGAQGGKAWLARLPDSRKINQESEQYVNPSYLGIQPFSVSNSVLRIKADVIPEGVTGVPINTAYEPDAPFKFYSGVITTHGIQTWTYGVFEIRCKASAINGIWPAFWLYNPLDAETGKYGEFDVLELIGDHPNRSYHFAHEYSGLNIHSTSKGRAAYFPPNSTIADWHVYAGRWEPGRLRWYVDGNLVQDMATTWIDDTPLYMIVNMAISTAAWTGADIASGAGDPNPAQLPAYMDVDYVRVYQVSLIDIDVTTFTTGQGDGAYSFNAETKTLSVAYGTTTTNIRGSHPTTVGKRYRLTWTYSGSAGMSMYAGTSVGGTQYRAAVENDALFDFTATSATLHMGFQRTTAGTTTVSNLKIQEIAAGAFKFDSTTATFDSTSITFDRI